MAGCPKLGHTTLIFVFSLYYLFERTQHNDNARLCLIIFCLKLAFTVVFLSIARIKKEYTFFRQDKPIKNEQTFVMELLWNWMYMVVCS